MLLVASFVRGFLNQWNKLNLLLLIVIRKYIYWTISSYMNRNLAADSPFHFPFLSNFPPNSLAVPADRKICFLLYNCQIYYLACHRCLQTLMIARLVDDFDDCISVWLIKIFPRFCCFTRIWNSCFLSYMFYCFYF